MLGKKKRNLGSSSSTLESSTNDLVKKWKKEGERKFLKKSLSTVIFKILAIMDRYDRYIGHYDRFGPDFFSTIFFYTVTVIW